MKWGISLKNWMAFINKKMGEGVMWNGLVICRVEQLMHQIKKSELDSSQWNEKGRGSPKITLIKLLKEHLLIKDVTKTMISDIIEWKNTFWSWLICRVSITKPKYLELSVGSYCCHLKIIFE